MSTIHIGFIYIILCNVSIYIICLREDSASLLSFLHSPIWKNRFLRVLKKEFRVFRNPYAFVGFGVATIYPNSFEIEITKISTLEFIGIVW
jgi:hypothetical protein